MYEADPSSQVVLQTIDDARQRLGVSRTTIYKLMSNGDLPSVSIGASRRIPSSALNDYIASLISRDEPTSEVLAA
jgi:excisionase family DNA binding protein